MDLNDVPLFVRIVETGSFSAAADDLGLQRSSVSRSIARLEESVGARLLQRTTRKLALTDAGQAFYDKVRGAVAGMEDAMNAVREIGTEPRGTVRLTAPPDAQYFGLAEALAEFTKTYPSILIDLTLTTRIVDLVGEGFDLAVRAGHLSDSSLIARRLGPTPLALFASPSYLKSAGVPRSLEDLARHDCVLFRGRVGKATWRLMGPNGEESIEVMGHLSVDDLSFVLRACVAGAGIGLLPAVLAREAARLGSIQHILPDYHLAGGSANIVLPTSALVPSRVALLRDHLVARLEHVLSEAQNQCNAALEGAKSPPKAPSASRKTKKAR